MGPNSQVHFGTIPSEVVIKHTYQLKPLIKRSNEVRSHSEANPGLPRQFGQVCVFSASTIVDRYRGQLREVKPLRMRSNLEVMLPFEVRGHSEANPGSLGRFVCFLLLCTVGNRYRGQIQEVKPLRKRSNLEVMVLVRLKFILRPTQACPGSLGRFVFFLHQL